MPAIVFADGPAGIRISATRDSTAQTFYATQFPIGTLLAATWDTVLVRRVGNAMGEEVHEYGADVLLGPGMNLQRNPLNGRNFEYFSEDPLLTGKIAAAIVNGIQQQGVGTSVKHFVANNQETNRLNNNTIVPTRALREMYLRPFEIVVKEAQPWTIMTSYNKLNGTYTAERARPCSRPYCCDEWGFKGLVTSDWLGGVNPVWSVQAGNDLLMPGLAKQRDSILKAIRLGTLSLHDVDRNVQRVLELILRSPHYAKYTFSNTPDLKASAAVARESAAEGMVLLKNDGTALPLPAQARKEALFGVTSYDFIPGGTGSGTVNSAYTVSLAQGLAAAESNRTRNCSWLTKAISQPKRPRVPRRSVGGRSNCVRRCRKWRFRTPKSPGWPARRMRPSSRSAASPVNCSTASLPPTTTFRRRNTG